MDSGSGKARMMEQEHRYGSRVHLLDDVVSASLLARLCQPATVQPEFNQLVGALYRRLAEAAMHHALPRKLVNVETAMAAHDPRGRLSSEVLDPSTRVVSVGIARAGTLPSMICFDTASTVLHPEGVRQDHLMMERQTNAAGEVIGAAMLGGKIGGPLGGAYAFLPDPMGATGRSIVAVMDHYRHRDPVPPTAWLALHLIITPEYIRYVQQHAPDLEVYALRVDRGASDPDVLSTIPGTHLEREFGLTDNDYILPGAGGVGERMNNTLT